MQSILYYWMGKKKEVELPSPIQEDPIVSLDQIIYVKEDYSPSPIQSDYHTEYFFRDYFHSIVLFFRKCFRK